MLTQKFSTLDAMPRAKPKKPTLWRKIVGEIIDDTGLIPAELARQIGVTPSAFSQWRNGITDGSPESILKVHDALGYSLRWLINMTGPKKGSAADDLWARYNNAPEHVRVAIDALLVDRDDDSGPSASAGDKFPRHSPKIR